MGGLIYFLKVLPEIEIPGAGDVAHQELAGPAEDRSSESSQLPITSALGCPELSFGL